MLLWFAQLYHYDDCHYLTLSGLSRGTVDIVLLSPIKSHGRTSSIIATLTTSTIATEELPEIFLSDVCFTILFVRYLQ